MSSHSSVQVLTEPSVWIGVGLIVVAHLTPILVFDIDAPGSVLSVSIAFVCGLFAERLAADLDA